MTALTKTNPVTDTNTESEEYSILSILEEEINHRFHNEENPDKCEVLVGIEKYIVFLRNDMNATTKNYDECDSFSDVRVVMKPESLIDLESELEFYEELIDKYVSRDELDQQAMDIFNMVYDLKIEIEIEKYQNS